ncbi:glycosyltransferase family 4 protein, partial [Candidatus Aerophobetes bacterium]|nr:glycosyltransferase family 4 protein [Candidatus Aerophobetes bacterium]
AINAEFMPAYTKEFNGFRRFIEAFKRAKELPDYDVYLLEGGMPLFPAYLKKRKNKNIKVIGLLADETFINLVERQPHYSFAETLIHRISARCLDGAISVSPMVKEYAERVIDVPIEIARPPISKENFVKLGKVKPDLESNIIISVGQPRYSIGMDILVEQFKHAKKEFPELELWIVGKGHPKEYESVNGVRVLGYVEELSEVFEKASLFVHAGRCSAYPVATLEAMRAGLPVVVSTMTGTKEIVERVESQIKREFCLNYEGNRFIQPLDRIFEGIVEYSRTDIEIREKMSEMYKKESEEFKPEKRAKEFKEVFNKLIEVIS